MILILIFALVLQFYVALSQDRTYSQGPITDIDLKEINEAHCQHTGKCIRRFGGMYAYCWYFIDRKR